MRVDIREHSHDAQWIAREHDVGQHELHDPAELGQRLGWLLRQELLRPLAPLLAAAADVCSRLPSAVGPAAETRWCLNALRIPMASNRLLVFAEQCKTVASSF